jgi:hypothetical protein
MPAKDVVLPGVPTPNRKVGSIPVVDLKVAQLTLTIFTTRPTTGLIKGDLLLLMHTSTPKIGVCTSTAAQTIKLIRLKTKTFGRLTA